MAVYNYQDGEVNIKIVYYGPGLSGKTTNLELMYSKLPREIKGKMVSMKTRTDRTLFFDFFPLEVGRVGDLNVRFLLYTVPGQVYYNATRKLVLKGADAVVFVADSSPDRLEDNLESLRNLEENLNELGMTLKEIPWVMQYNKRDVSGCLPRELLDKELNAGGAPVLEAVAVTGTGVRETFEAIAGLVFGKLRNDPATRRAVGDKSAPARAREPISAEVVVQGAKRIGHSETGESETSGYAEEREEEHESVSEFVDNMLKEGAGDEPAEDLSSNGGGYEEYGHIVELGDEPGAGKQQAETAGARQAETAGARQAETAGARTTATEEETAPCNGRPLQSVAIGTPAAADEGGGGEAESAADGPAPAGPARRTIRVPLVLSATEARAGVAVTVCMDISVED